MSVMRCPKCCNQWDSDYEDREGELCGNCEEAEAEVSDEESTDAETRKAPLLGLLRTGAEASRVGIASNDGRDSTHIQCRVNHPVELQALTHTSGATTLAYGPRPATRGLPKSARSVSAGPRQGAGESLNEAHSGLAPSSKYPHEWAWAPSVRSSPSSM